MRTDFESMIGLVEEGLRFGEQVKTDEDPIHLAAGTPGFYTTCRLFELVSLGDLQSSRRPEVPLECRKIEWQRGNESMVVYLSVVM